MEIIIFFIPGMPNRA